MTGFLTLHAAPTGDLHAANKAYVDSRALAGGTLTGMMKLPTSIPVSSNEDLTNKLYVDSAVSGALPRAGGTLTGVVFYALPRAGISADDASDKFTKVSHGFKTGRAVVMLFSSGFGGLTSGSTYYVVRVNDDEFKLAASLEDAQLSTPTTIDITSSGTGASAVPMIEVGDQLVTREYVEDLLGISGEVLLTAGGEMLGAITGSHGLVQANGDKPMTGALVLASLPDAVLDETEAEETWAIDAFSQHLDDNGDPVVGKIRVYLSEIENWKFYSDISITGTSLYDGVYEVEDINLEEQYVVISGTFTGSTGGTATQLTGGLYVSQATGQVSYRRRRFLTQGITQVVSGNHVVQPGEGVILSTAETATVVDLGSAVSAAGPVTVKKVGSSTGASVIVKAGYGGQESNLVLDSMGDSVTLEPVNGEWRVSARVRAGEELTRVQFLGSRFISPGISEIDIQTLRGFEKTTKSVSVGESSGNLLIEVEDASDFSTASFISIEGSRVGYNGNYSKTDIISVNPADNKITLANRNSVSIVDEVGLFVTASVFEPVKASLLATVSPTPSDIHQTQLSSRIAGFMDAGSGYTDVVLGEPVSLTAITDLVVPLEGVTADEVSDVLTFNSHGLQTGQPVVITFDSGFGGLTSGNTYYVIALTANTFQLALSDTDAAGGVEIDITSAGLDATVTPQADDGFPSGSLVLTVDELPAGIEAGDRVNVIGGDYEGSYVVESLNLDGTQIIVAGSYTGDLVSPEVLSRALDASAWIAGYHSLAIDGTASYDTDDNGGTDIISVDAINSRLTIKATYVDETPPNATAFGNPAHALIQHPFIFGRFLSGDGTTVAAIRTDGDGFLSSYVTNKALIPNAATSADITGEINGSFLHMNSGGISDVVGRAVGTVAAPGASIYSAGITAVSNGGSGTVWLTLSSMTDWRVGDLIDVDTVSGSYEGSSIRVLAVDVLNSRIRIAGTWGADTTGTATNKSVIQLTLADSDSGAFNPGDQVVIRGVTALGSDEVFVTVSATAAYAAGPPAVAPIVTIRGFNKSTDIQDGDPLVGVSADGTDANLVFPVPHRLSTGQKILIEFSSGFTGLTPGNSYWVINDGALKIKVAASEAEALTATAIDITAAGIDAVVTVLTTVENPFEPAESTTGSIEVSTTKRVFSIKPWSWLSHRSVFTLDTTNITSWGDHSGNSRPFLAAANWPTASTLSDLPSALFGNTSVIGLSISIPKSQPLTIVFVAEPSATGTILESSTPLSLVLGSAGATYTLSGASSTSLALTVGSGEEFLPGVYTIVLNGPESRIRKYVGLSNGLTREVRGTISGGFTTSINIGKSSGGFAGNVGTFMIFESALNDDQISFIEESLAYEYGRL